MEIKHLQKTTLIDYPGKIACTIFLFGCNFRCGFCHNPELVKQNHKENYSISEEEILEFLEKRKNQLEGVCFTGGEPLLTLKKEFVEKMKSLGYRIKLDTNGSFPEKLEEFIQKDLIDFVSMDIKTIPEEYQNLTNSDINNEKIEKSMNIIANSSKLEGYEFRTTILMSHHPEEKFEKMVEWLYNIINKEEGNNKIKKFSLQGFKNSGKLMNREYEKEPNTTESHLKKLEKITKPYVEKVEIRE